MPRHMSSFVNVGSTTPVIRSATSEAVTPRAVSLSATLSVGVSSLPTTLAVTIPQRAAYHSGVRCSMSS
jgi:hypothetical protein